MGLGVLKCHTFKYAGVLFDSAGCDSAWIEREMTSYIAEWKLM